jgi:hypothetical protein
VTSWFNIEYPGISFKFDSEQRKILRLMAIRYQVQNGLLYKRSTKAFTQARPSLPFDLSPFFDIIPILKSCHDHRSSGHSGITMTFKRLQLVSIGRTTLSVLLPMSAHVLRVKNSLLGIPQFRCCLYRSLKETWKKSWSTSLLCP